MAIRVQPRTDYDAIVVGSGAAGGMAAYSLTRGGARVLMLEAGRDYRPAIETPMFQKTSDAPLRDASTPDKPNGFYDATVDGGWEVPGEPYTVAEGSQFRWWRARMLGGRTNHYGRLSPRFGPYDFKGRTRDGIGVDWPITYDDLAPYYDRVEALVGVFSGAAGLENEPVGFPHVILPPPRARVNELFVKAGCDAIGIPCEPNRVAVLTRPFNSRSACLYATACRRGCSIGANFQSTTVLIPPAMLTGRLTLQTNAVVRSIRLDARGRADGVFVIDRLTGREDFIRARSIVLAASTCESAKILLNSRNALFPDGLANTSGLVGRNLTDTPASTVWAQFPALETIPAHNEEGVSIPHMYIPWWGYQQQAQGKLDFPRGYHVEFRGDRLRTPHMADGLGIGEYAAFLGGYGAEFKRRMRGFFGSTVRFSVRGEMIPNDGTYCEIDPNIKDRWGIPVLRFHWRWTDYERNAMRHGRQTMARLVDRLGGRFLPGFGPNEVGLSIGGSIIHEAGTVRMGSDRLTSVTNSFGQTWDVKNLFVLDGGIMPSVPHKNLTLTIKALAYRGSDFLLEQFKAKSI